jgi:hypothetical protein
VTSPAGRAVTEAHRHAQLRLGAQTVTHVHALWPILDPERLDATFAAWANAVRVIVNAQRVTSARLAAGYYTTLRRVEHPAASTFTPVLAGPVNSRALHVSLLVAGPISVKNAMQRAVPLARASDVAAARSAGESMRHALGAGRETISRSVARDPASTGWQRVASAGACDFCASLADGEIVGGEDAVQFEAHALCSCTAEPAFVAG